MWMCILICVAAALHELLSILLLLIEGHALLDLASRTHRAFCSVDQDSRGLQPEHMLYSVYARASLFVCVNWAHVCNKFAVLLFDV